MGTTQRISRRRNAALLLAANGLALLVLGSAVEIAGRVFLLLRPSYDVVFLQPDRDVGWRQVPGHRYTWAGPIWYAADFSVPIRVNAHGFRDLERDVSKPPGTKRVALLGDSLVEAMQVPFERTAAQQLERRLARKADASGRYEVLNFGISNYRVGQYLLVWEAYAGQFEPDYVILFVAEFHLTRTLTRFASGAFGATRGRALRVRPTFRVEGGALVREPAADFEAFVRVQRELIQAEFDGRRSRVRERSVLGHFARRWLADDPSPAAGSRGAPAREDVFQVNEAVIRELHRQVREAGAVLAMVDAAAYFTPRGRAVSRWIETLCDREGIGHIPLSSRLAESDGRGEPTRWAHDGHFNETGNEILAAAIHEWLAHRSRTPGASRGGDRSR